MLRKSLLRPPVARILLVAQLLPVLALRPEAYTLRSQEWWLPALLAALAAAAAVQVLVRGTQATWPWYLFSFAQGFSIISKLMMLMPHATVVVDGVQRIDVAHVTISLVSMAASAFVIWYCEQVEVRNMFVSSEPSRAKTN
jgi:hypothetical protein